MPAKVFLMVIKKTQLIFYRKNTVHKVMFCSFINEYLIRFSKIHECVIVKSTVDKFESIDFLESIITDDLPIYQIEEDKFTH